MDRLPIADNALSRPDRGIVTGGTSDHWPCLGALAIAAAKYQIGFAVADHGLTAAQLSELNRCGVQWIEHPQPDIEHARNNNTIALLKAWWKPWVCEASPFEESVWIDSDAVLTDNPSPLFDMAPAVSTQLRFLRDGTVLYRDLVTYLFGEPGVQALPQFAVVNSGVIAWKRGDGFIEHWLEWTKRLLADDQAVKYCTVRDQSSMLALLIDLHLSGKPMPTLLDATWNCPADLLNAKQCEKRRSVPLQPQALLETTIARHPGECVVHWLGQFKPWGRQDAQPAKKQPPPLRQRLQERAEQLKVKYPNRTTYRTAAEALAILEWCCMGCERFNQKTERCSKIKGCAKSQDFEHSLIDKRGKCPDGKWGGK